MYFNVALGYSLHLFYAISKLWSLGLLYNLFILLGCVIAPFFFLCKGLYQHK
uniref:Uncharacterized protein n=1 Tax=Rhizophora mucronata TaxID=61149 RepID=A0A2P2PVY9_RHIMU